MVPPLGSTLGRWQVPAGVGNDNLSNGEKGLQRGGDWDLVSQHSGLWVPLKQRRIVVTSSVCLQPD